MNNNITVLILIALLSVPHLIFSQKDELRLSYSPLSPYRTEISLEHYDNVTNHYALGSINLDYYHYLTSCTKIGVSLLYDQEHLEGYHSSLDYIGDNYTVNNRVFVFASQIEVEYLNTKRLKLGTGFSVGYALKKKAEPEVYYPYNLYNGITYHLNLTSFRWGKKQGLYGHLGYGYKGYFGIGFFRNI